MCEEIPSCIRLHDSEMPDYVHNIGKFLARSQGIDFFLNMNNLHPFQNHNLFPYDVSRLVAE